MNGAPSWLDKPTKLLMWLACAFGVLMMFHVSADVVARVVFNSPLMGTIEIVSAYYMVALSFLPLAYVTQHGTHITVEMFTNGLKPRSLLRLKTIVDAVSFVYIAVFAWRTGLAAVDRTLVNELWETAGGYIPIWPARWSLPIASVLMCLLLLVRIRRNLARAPGM